MRKLRRVKEEFEQWLSAVPVIGFNSQKYDLNVLKHHLVRELSRDDDFCFVVKRTNSLACVETRRLRFLDVTNYIAPGFNYAKYVKAFGCSQEKGHFPYEWMDSLHKLEQRELPP